MNMKFSVRTEENHEKHSLPDDPAKIITSYLLNLLLAKAVPLQAWTGPQDSSRFRLPDFKTIGI
jgi:hypothetical protein